MKVDIDCHKYETWADLEIGMGIYSSQCADKNVFLKCLADIKSNLQEYLKKESEKIDSYKLDSTSGFVNPGLFLDPEPRNRYDSYCALKKTCAPQMQKPNTKPMNLKSLNLPLTLNSPLELARLTLQELSTLNL